MVYVSHIYFAQNNFESFSYRWMGEVDEAGFTHKRVHVVLMGKLDGGYL